MSTPGWITSWQRVQDGVRYLVCPIYAPRDGNLSLGPPRGFMMGWEVKRLMERCYAALECPPFHGLEGTPARAGDKEGGSV